MHWKKFRIKTRADAEELICAVLMEHPLSGVEIEDHLPLTEEEKRQMFVDIPLRSCRETDDAYISFYLEDTEEGESILSEILKEIEDLRKRMDPGECSIEVSETRDTDWVNNWKQFFHCFSVGDVMIRPSWEERNVSDEDCFQGIILEMDPGTAFGTGTHETTKLCIKSARRYVKKGDYILDIGCGSGILGIVSVKSGAAFATGIDLDPCAVDVSRDNFCKNGIEDHQYMIIQGNILSDSSVVDEVAEYANHGGYDVVFANILAEVLLEITPCVSGLVKPGGYYLTSGILAEKVESVEECILREGFDVTEILYDGEWAAIAALRKAE